MKKKILMSIMVIAIAAILMVGATAAYLSDQETSLGNTFTAGTLDLTINGDNANVVRFNIPKLIPGNQPSGAYILKNIGNVNGYLDLSSIVVTNIENGITEPEAEAGDTTPDVGELGDVLNLRLYFDNDKDGYYSTGDVYIYDGKASNIASSYNSNKLIPAGEDIRIMAVFDWWSSANDNLAQGDTLVVDFTFVLSQVQ